MNVTPSYSVVTTQFSYVPEFEEFLNLFPHRGSYLWAEHPQPGERPDWQTENRHLLSDRLILQGAYLYGVRFGATTNYLLIDLDRGSIYHPYRDPLAVGRIVAALEPAGLSRYVAVTSSYSAGFHLYFPFLQGQTSWLIARLATALLANAGFKIAKGQLELFPNARRLGGVDYNGHRLPLQAGSYLLNDDFHPGFTTHDEFCHQWRWCQQQNSVLTNTLTTLLKQHERRAYHRLGHKAQKFLNDLNAEIEAGWTGYSQTNHLLGKIAIREYAFHHALYGGEPLTGLDLEQRILEVALSLPGYRDYCQHQDDIAKRVEEWARSVEQSPSYYPYGHDNPLTLYPTPLLDPVEPSWNQKQAQDAQHRIRLAVAELKEKGEWPSSTRAQIFALKKCKVSSATLYRYKELWHVDKTLKPLPSGVIHPVGLDRDDPKTLKPLPSGVIHPVGPISFISALLSLAIVTNLQKTEGFSTGSTPVSSTKNLFSPNPFLEKPQPRSDRPTRAPSNRHRLTRSPQQPARLTSPTIHQLTLTYEPPSHHPVDRPQRGSVLHSGQVAASGVGESQSIAPTLRGHPEPTPSHPLGHSSL